MLFLGCLNHTLFTDRGISSVEFGNKHKVHSPNKLCEDPYEELDDESTVDKCQEFVSGKIFQQYLLKFENDLTIK